MLFERKLGLKFGQVAIPNKREGIAYNFNEIEESELDMVRENTFFDQLLYDKMKEQFA